MELRPRRASSVTKISRHTRARASTPTSTVQKARKKEIACELRYADGKPKPVLRGVMHGIIAIGVLICVFASRRDSDLPIALPRALLCKACTYGVSAIFHLVPFASVRSVIWAFTLDLICVPFAPYGHLIPFADDSSLASTSAFACVLLLNTALVVWQTQGMTDLRTPVGRTDTPRVAFIAIYSAYAIYRCGAFTGFQLLWWVMLGLWAPAVFCADRVSTAHEHEPTATFAKWHVPGVWSFHEDLHTCIAIGDGVWLMLVLYS